MSGGPRRIAVVTGSRAEYGLLRFLMRAIASDERLELQVVATGMHLSPAFGSTFREIEADGFAIAAKVHMLVDGDDPVAVAKSVALGVSGFADALAVLRPDVVVVLGDRFEILAAAQAAMLMRVPIAHVHGGESSEGAVDESIRHAVTKMAHLHFVAAAPYRQRVLQLGEGPERVFDFGAPGLDALSLVKLASRDALERDLGLPLSAPLFLVTYHPATLGEVEPTAAVARVLAALDAFPEATTVVTRPNADAGGRGIGAAIDAWASGRPRTVVRTSLGQTRYLSVMKLASVVVGNSSSGLIEAPALRVPTVNVGDRQRGRLSAASVLDCPEDTSAIVATIRAALSPEHADRTAAMVPPYGTGNGASTRIKDVLATVPLEGLSNKRFHDLS